MQKRLWRPRPSAELAVDVVEKVILTGVSHIVTGSRLLFTVQRYCEVQLHG